jgi:hypothetical protein
MRVNQQKLAVLEYQEQLEQAMTALQGPAPCDDCRHSARCGAERLACDAFAHYARGLSETRWRVVPRQPTRGRYTQLFTAA